MKWKLLLYLLVLNVNTITKGQTASILHEKVFLHTSDDSLKQGETLWFKGYLNSTLPPDQSDQVLYVDLISLKSRSVIQRKVLYLQQGMGQGDFYFGSNLSPGNYLLRGYTKWMINYSANSVFEKPIHLLSVDGSIGLKSQQEGSYVAPDKDKKHQKLHLSGFSDSGAAMRLKTERDSLQIEILKTIQDTTNKTPYLLLGKKTGAYFWRQAVPLSKDSTVIKVHKKLIPRGLFSFELYHGSKQVCARYGLLPEDGLEQQIEVQSYQSGDSVTLKIRSSPGTHLSLSVAGGSRHQYPDIKTYFDLVSELKQGLANDYLKLPAPDMAGLVLSLSSKDLRELPSEENLPFSYAPEKGMSIKGRVINRKKGMPDVNVSLFLNAPPNSLLQAAKTDSSGRFNFEDLVFFGKAQAKLVAMNGSGEKVGTIELDSTFTTLAVPVLPSDSLGAYSVKHLASHQKLGGDSIIKISGQLLKEVVVKEQAKIPLLNGIYKALHKDQIFNLGMEDLEYRTLTAWLLNHVKGAFAPVGPEFTGAENGVVFYCNDTTGVEFTDNTFSSKTKPLFPQFVVNGRLYSSESKEVETAYREQFFDTRLDKIQSVRVQRLTGFLTAAPGALVERVVIYLTVKDLDREKGTLAAEVNGFNQSTSYNQSASNTIKNGSSPLIYWNPDIVTDYKGEAIVRFQNLQKNDAVVYELQGQFTEGEPVSWVSTYRTEP